MELKEFMKNFSKIGNEKFLSEDGTEMTGFNIKDFPKALQNFADKICEMQRKNCLESSDTKEVVAGVHAGGNTFSNSYRTVIDAKSIINAPQPKIEKL